jgi:two-component system NtrC family sensor kinase
VSSAIIRDRDDRILGGVQTFRDITDEKQRQTMMYHTEKLAAIGHLSAGLAHEINNPIGNVVGYAKLLLRDASFVGKQRERLEIISEQAERAADIVKELLNYSRRQELKKERISINSIIDKVIRLVSPQTEKNNIEIIRRLGDVPYIKADPRQIEQVMFNIILNAIQAIGSDGKVNIKTSETTDGFIEVRIEDTGPGIPEEYIRKIFDPFFTTKPVNKGTGLGLSVCMGIIREHKGSIEVESEYGKGAAFIIKLPVTEDEDV